MATCTGRRAILMEPLAVAQILIPSNVGRQLVVQGDGPFAATGVPHARRLSVTAAALRVDRELAEGEGTGVCWVSQHPKDGTKVRRSPFKLALVGSINWTHRDSDVMLLQIAHEGMGGFGTAPQPSSSGLA